VRLAKALLPILVTELGIVNVVRDVALLKVVAAILVMELEMDKNVSDLRLKKAPTPMLVTESGMVKDTSEFTLEKALEPMVVTELGIVRDVNAVAAVKALLSIVVTEFPNEIEVREYACLKAEEPMLVTESGIVTLVIGEGVPRPLQKAPVPILVTPRGITTTPVQELPSVTTSFVTVKVGTPPSLIPVEHSYEPSGSTAAFADGEIPIDTKTTRSKNETTSRILLIALYIGHSPTLDYQESKLAQLVTLKGHAER